MNIYHPDRWIIVNLSNGEQSYDKIFSGNYGGFAGSDTWKLSSSIEKIIKDEDGYEVYCSSGSMYVLNKHAYGMSSYMGSILATWQKAAEEPTATVKITILDEYDRT